MLFKFRKIDSYIVLESKHYRTKLNKTSLTLLIEKIRKTYQIERHIAKKNNQLQLHHKKWNPFLHLVEQQLSKTLKTFGQSFFVSIL